MIDLDFQGYAMKIKKLIITVGFLDPKNIPMKNTPVAVFGWRNTLGV